LRQLNQLRTDYGTAVLLITHDLGIVAQTCEQVRVMYCGKIIEQAPVGTLFSAPAHPYTAGLLAAVPRMSGDTPRQVKAIPGLVPEPLAYPAGCRFSDRCVRADSHCRNNAPRLLPPAEQVSETLSSASPTVLRACHHPLEAAP
jgi:oligopeptide/dipeptide ABC transporter ATP-binding protein